MKNLTFGFAGLGLIGGSIAKALRKKYPGCTILVYDTDEKAADLAFKEGVANVLSSSPGEAFTACHYVFLCAPVSHNNNNLSALRQYLSPHCLITDVGSVKAPIHRHAALLGLEQQFIGGHPMTGSERTGFANAKEGLLENAYYILTPTRQVSSIRLEQYRELISDLGALPLILSWEEHDYITAAVSHLPHIIAASLVSLIRDSDSPQGLMKLIAAGGFKDITRIASGSPAMWQQICLNNHRNIDLLLEKYIHALLSIKEKIKGLKETDLYHFFEEARTYRDSLSDFSDGPIPQCHSVYVDIPDRTGTLAAIVSLLSGHGINIKNIGISHNREQEAGVLLVEFYDETSVNCACALFASTGYIFHTRI